MLLIGLDQRPAKTPLRALSLTLERVKKGFLSVTATRKKVGLQGAAACRQMAIKLLSLCSAHPARKYSLHDNHPDPAIDHYHMRASAAPRGIQEKPPGEGGRFSPDRVLNRDEMVPHKVGNKLCRGPGLIKQQTREREHQC
jgi:hypothetical protein